MKRNGHGLRLSSRQPSRGEAKQSLGTRCWRSKGLSKRDYLFKNNPETD